MLQNLQDNYKVLNVKIIGLNEPVYKASMKHKDQSFKKISI